MKLIEKLSQDYAKEHGQDGDGPLSDAALGFQAGYKKAREMALEFFKQHFVSTQEKKAAYELSKINGESGFDQNAHLVFGACANDIACGVACELMSTMGDDEVP